MKVRRSRLRQATALLLASSALVSANTAPSLYDYLYDGTSTYCYWMDQGMQVSNFDFAYVQKEGTDSQCPLTISLQQSTTGTILPGSEVEYAFTATLNFNDNVFNLTKLQATVPDPTTGLPMQIGHANIHTCSRSTVCDIFRTGSNRKIADQETSNFTSAGTASFRQKIVYTSAGERNVFAHIILPPSDYLKESYHFITFVTTNVEASTTSAADEQDSGLSAGATIGIVIAAVAIVVAVILSVVFYRRKRRPGQDTDHFRNSGFGLPASYVANKSKSHLDWNAEPESRLTSHGGSGWKDNYSAGDRSHGSRGPGLNASALAFNDRLSRQNKTVSSSGSLHSSRGPGDSGLVYNNYDTPMQRSNNRDPFSQSQGMYGDAPPPSEYENGSRIIEEDPSLEYGRTPDLETFGINGQGPSFESETSMGTSFEYNTDEHFAQPPFNPLLSGYGRESDLSSMGETEEYNMYEQPPPRMRGDTLDAMLTAMPDDEGSESGENRTSSVSSIGTVDFTEDVPSVRGQKPIAFEPLDETLTLSGYNKTKTDLASTNGFAHSNTNDNTEFVMDDNSTMEFATSNASTDFASTGASSVDIDGKTVDTSSEYASDIVSSADIVSTTDFEASSNADFTSNVASTEFSASSNGDFTKPSSYSQSDFGDSTSFSSDLEGSSYSSGLGGSSYGTDVTGSSYGTGLTGSSYGTDTTGNSYNTNLADSALDAHKTETDLNSTHSTYDFDDKSYRASDSLGPGDSAASYDDPTAGEGLRPRRVSSADGESYEF